MIDDMIAIDFGTARTKVAYFNPATQTVELMYLGEDGKPFIPSYAGRDPADKDKILVGEAAVDLLERGVGIVTDALKRAFLAEDEKQSDRIEELNDLPPKESLASLYTEVRTRAGKHSDFKGQPSAVVLTYWPEYLYDDREALKEVAADSGFDKDKIETIDEITAAGYFFQTQVEETALPKDIIVVDVGAGTTDWLYLLLHESGRYGRHPDFHPRTVRFGGYHIDDYLADLVKDRVEGNTIDRVYVRNQTRLHKEWYCMGYLRQTRVRAHPGKDEWVQLDSHDIQEAISEAFVKKVSSELLEYAETVIAETKRKPTFILTGGGATFKGLKGSLDAKFAVEQSDSYEYATVLGAMHYARNQKVGRNTYTHKKQAEPITALAFSSKGELLAGASGKNVTLWESIDQNFRSIRTVLKHEDAVTSLAFSPDDRCIATVTAAKGSTINLWNAETGENIKKFEPQPALIRCITFSPDSKLIASGDSAYAVKLWDVDTGKSEETFVGKNGKHRHKGYVNSITFSHDGTMLASGGQDCTVKRWYVGREKKPDVGKPHSRYYSYYKTNKGHQSPIVYVYFDGPHRMGTLAMDGTILLWADAIFGRRPTKVFFDITEGPLLYPGSTDLWDSDALFCDSWGTT